ncbi:hypothetical protein D3C72_1345040 [compost metagenome]
MPEVTRASCSGAIASGNAVSFSRASIKASRASVSGMGMSIGMTWGLELMRLLMSARFSVTSTITLSLLSRAGSLAQRCSVTRLARSSRPM